MATSKSRKPDFSLGRFFLSPILGCKARCSYCYIFSEGYTSKVFLNEFSIHESIEWILNHREYKPGINGSILSIGAWGDPFPPSNLEAGEYTLEWLKALCDLRNPVQLISKFAIDESVINEICSFIKYENQLLFSTSISTFKHWKDIELNTDSPLERLEVLHSFHGRGIPTNVMIKPFLNGITDKEVKDFVQYFNQFKVRYCVVGSLHWNEFIYDFMKRTGRGVTEEISSQFIENEKRKQLFDCTTNQSLYTYSSSVLNDFISQLQSAGINVFKKSTCVNSNILKVNNVSLFYEIDPNNFCVKCGTCDQF